MRIENEILMHLRALKKTANTVYLQDPINKDAEGNEITILDIISQKTDPVSEKADLSFDVEILERAMKKVLNKREFTILAYRYGLFNLERITQREIAKALGISRSFVSRIEKKALEKLKTVFDGEEK